MIKIVKKNTIAPFILGRDILPGRTLHLGNKVGVTVVQSGAVKRYAIHGTPAAIRRMERQFS